ncbi:MAG: diphosphatase [Solirubrobacteraceae bacterium]|jgi:NAD+ diphosphatase|nr:diphosphatase [Solirubrobacteraceae bacterium]
MAAITFAGGNLDRATDRRADAEWVLAARSDPRARAVVASSHGVLLDGAAPQPGADAWAAGVGDALRPWLVELDDREAILLGLTADGTPLWAVEAAGEEDLTGLREAAPLLSAADAGLLAHAQQLLHWRRTHRFCGTCGHPTEPREAGHVRVCDNGHQIHPRTDPVVIMLVVDPERDRVLLGRQPSWPAGRYSALAGFVEPGETLEAAVAREVREEARVDVSDVRYCASQPWPFPANLMLGFEATWTAGEVRADEAELEDARWFTRGELEAAAREDPGCVLLLPPPLAIARRLIDEWLTAGA